MQQIRIDFDNPGLPQSLGAVEGESQSRIFQAALYKSGAAYTAPAGAVYSIMYRGFGPQNQGWYDTIEDGTGKRAACTVSGNVVTCELARQALRVPGHLTVVLCVTDAKGYMLKNWPIMADVRNDGYEDTGESEMYFNLSGIAGNYLTQLEKAMADAETTRNNLISTSAQVKKDIDAKAAETLKSIPESYTELDGSVKQLKEDFDNFVFTDYNLKRITQFFGIRSDNVNVINNGGNSDVHTVDGGMFFEIHVKEGETYQFNTKVTDDNFRYVITNASNNIIYSSTDKNIELQVKMPQNAFALLINHNQNLLPQSECNIFLVESLSNNNDKHVYYSTDLPNGFENMIGDGVTDNTRQFQAILNYMGENGGGTLIIKDGVYAFNRPSVDKDNYNSIIKIPYVQSTTSSPVPINIIGENEIATAYPENVSVPPIKNGAIFLITADTVGLENTIFPAFIGAKHTGSETYNNQDYTNVTLNIKNLIFRQQQQGVLTDLQLKYVANVNLENIVCDCTGDYANLTYSGYNTSHGVIMPTLNNYGFERIRNLYVIGRGTGLKHSEHLDADNLFFQRCGTAIAVQQSNHASYYGKILVQHCVFAISGDGRARIYNGVLDVELNEGDNYKFINDYTNNLYGDITIHAVFGGIGAKNDMETISKYINGANNLVINTEEIPNLTGNTDSEKLENLINILKSKKMIR